MLAKSCTDLNALLKMSNDVRKAIGMIDAGTIIKGGNGWRWGFQVRRGEFGVLSEKG